MGFLTSILSKWQNDAEEVQDGNRMPDLFPELREGMSVSVLEKDGKELLSGKLVEFSQTELRIERLPGWLAFPVCDTGATVRVRGFNKDMTPFYLKGTVQAASRVCYKLKDLKVEPFNEQRYNFRLTLNCPASLYYQSDEQCKNPEECTLVDISTGGACIETEFLHAEDEILRLKVKIEEYKPMLFIGQIIRVTEFTPGKNRCGFLFAQLQETEQTELTRTLYNIQLGNRKTWTRTEDGHW